MKLSSIMTATAFMMPQLANITASLPPFIPPTAVLIPVLVQAVVIAGIFLIRPVRLSLNVQYFKFGVVDSIQRAMSALPLRPKDTLLVITVILRPVAPMHYSRRGVN